MTMKDENGYWYNFDELEDVVADALYLDVSKHEV